ncbi:MAG: class II glutamine amidotransferase [Polyangiaceae bacterium]|nr:class II glutamine amidotransferase [Polyangiaceae bacterium]
MARMFGLIGNRPDLATRVLQAHAAVLHCQCPPGRSVGWGVGFYQNGEVLLRRRPSDDRPLIDLTESGIEMRTDAVIGHVREACVGALRTENTQPFRYRSWLFAQRGTVHGFDRLGPRLLDNVATFLRPNVRGDTDAELVCYVFLSFLHDANELDAPRTEHPHVVEALRASIALVDRLSAEEGYPENDLDLLVSNGESIYAVHGAGGMGYRELAGRRDAEALLLNGDQLGARIPGIEQTRYTLIASPVPPATPEWTRLPSRVIFTAAREAPPTVEPL